MDTYKRKINLRHFAPQSGVNKDIVVDSDNCFLPHAIIKDESGNTIEELPIKWETYNHYKGWLERFIVESEIYEMRKRDDEFVFVNAREYNEDYLKTVKFKRDNGEEARPAKDYQLPLLIQWFCNACGFYEDIYAARNGVTSECCERNLKVFVNPNMVEFFEMFGSECSPDYKKNACWILSNNVSGTSGQNIDIPILISNDIQDLGMYDVYDFKKSGAYSEEELPYPEYIPVYRTLSSDTLYVESKLDTLLRTRKTYDEDGNILPYCFNPEKNRNELPYMLDIPCDITYSTKAGSDFLRFLKEKSENKDSDHGCFLCNILKEIHYYWEGGMENTAARDVVYYNGTMPTDGIIEFVYRVGVIYDESGKTCNDESGIEYREKRKYKVKSVPNGSAIIISDSTIDNPEDYDPEKQYAVIEVTNEEFCEYLYNSEPYYTKKPPEIEEKGIRVKNDAFMSIQDFLIMKDNVYIDRGTSAAYEAFNVLGETNTIEDIENYRDDWFRIRGKND